jgi:uncharacterized protein
VRRYSNARLAAWFAVVGSLAVLNYTVRFTGAADQGENDSLYSYTAAISGLVFYAIFFAFVYAIAAVDTDDLFALRRPRSWGRAIGLAFAVIVGSLVWGYIVSRLPLPQSPSEEQGVAPDHWEPEHLGAYLANFATIAIVAPIIEELTFRGVGYRLLVRFGEAAAIVVVGVMFGLAHGLVEGLIVLVPLGMALAYVRAKTDSVYPPILIHMTFNSLALLSVIGS